MASYPSSVDPRCKHGGSGLEISCRLSVSFIYIKHAHANGKRFRNSRRYSDYL